MSFLEGLTWISLLMGALALSALRSLPYRSVPPKPRTLDRQLKLKLVIRPKQKNHPTVACEVNVA
jgi:hypothetical protein